jgi:flagellar biosynthesis protein FlhF
MLAAAAGIRPMPPEIIGRLEAMSVLEPIAEPAPTPGALAATSTEQDAERLSMSTLSFQDYVRKRMLRRRQASLGAAHGSTTTSSTRLGCVAGGPPPTPAGETT